MPWLMGEEAFLDARRGSAEVEIYVCAACKRAKEVDVVMMENWIKEGYRLRCSAWM